MNPLLLGFLLLYGIPGVLALIFWAGPIRRLTAVWWCRDVSLSLIPERRHVAHTERLLRIVR